MVIIVEGMGENVVAEARAVARQLFVRHGFVAAHQGTRNDAAWPSLPEPKLHGLHLHVVPVCPERRENAAMVRHVAIPVGRTLPNAHGLQMRRL